ncbi:MAG TPA: SDR family oxidoreductase [Saprospiraceae bacterium]|nr:SDR family oxidoreductase [Saprospiraceae bacterium]
MIFKNELFKDKVVLVTGGGSGIGRETARQYLQLGARVHISSRKEERLKKAVETLSQWGKVEYFPCDIREVEQIEALAQKIKREEGRLDILINNAGGQFPTQAEDLNKKGWDAVINNNLNGTWYMTHVMARHFFIPQKQGSIVNVIVNIYRGVPGMVHTGAARAGIDNFTKTLSVEWSKYNININAIAPGIIYSSGLQQYPEKLTRGIAEKIPLKRLGSVEEVAQLILFTTSPMATYITGETIYIDGGWRLYGDIYTM